jgi:hypothetical protein
MLGTQVPITSNHYTSFLLFVFSERNYLQGYIIICRSAADRPDEGHVFCSFAEPFPSLGVYDYGDWVHMLASFDTGLNKMINIRNVVMF